MPIIYSLVARRDVILANYSTTSGNFINISNILLNKLPLVDSQKTYEYDGYS